MLTSSERGHRVFPGSFVPSVVCGLAVILAALLSWAFADGPICDDWSYVRTAFDFARTGHFVYYIATPILSWMVLLAQPFIHVLGYTYTACRLSTLLMAAVTAAFFHRILLRAGVHSRLALFGTLCVALSPLTMLVSTTFHSDIYGLFSILVCLYAALRFLQADSFAAAARWIVTAAVGNALLGSARQIAWLGFLVIVPSALWLRRKDRRLLAVGALAYAVAAVILVLVLHWFNHQPYILHESLLPGEWHLRPMARNDAAFFLNLLLLLAPVLALFAVPFARKRPAAAIAAAAVALGYLAAAQRFIWPLPSALSSEHGDLLSLSTLFSTKIQQPAPIVVPFWFGSLLFAVAAVGLAGVAAALLLTTSPRPDATDRSTPALGILLGPFFAAYALLLTERSLLWLYDRYAVPLLFLCTLLLLHLYQQRVRAELPRWSSAIVLFVAFAGICVAHNYFAFTRARIRMANQVDAMKLDRARVDLGWEWDMLTELRFSPYINLASSNIPADHPSAPPPPPPGMCDMASRVLTPHVRPEFGVAYTPTACLGVVPASAPISFTEWPTGQRTTLYLVRYRSDAALATTAP